MNRKELETVRRNNLNRLETGYRSNVNRFEYDSGNSIEHEMAKFISFVLLRNGCPANLLPEALYVKSTFTGEEHPIKGLIRLYGQKFKEDWRRPMVVTEARFKPLAILRRSRPNDTRNLFMQGRPSLKIVPLEKQGRRADLFLLDSGEIVEIETDPKIKKEGDNVITVRI